MLGRFTLVFSEGVKKDLKGLRAYDARILLEAIEIRLAHAPDVETKNRKRLQNLVPPFEAIAPIWQLRVGTFRIFYDINEAERYVSIRAIRRKPAHLNTEEIL
ncbi:MAG: type II toxin-antitoxin system RelE/ParE family toxin [Candidatus Omnitrophota bacterium]|nr:type II toxin-antitoxin system RelE/ParE family toxin [Candidatus Omnitrophota bacterium]